MRGLACLGLAALATAAIATAANGQTAPTPPTPAPSTPRQAPAAGAAAPAAPAPARPAAPANPKLGETIGLVNGEPITKRDLVNILGQFQIPPGSEARAYEAATELVVNDKILEQFLRKANIAVPPKEIEDVIALNRKSLQDQGSSLEKVLADTNTTFDDFKNRIARSLQWKAFVVRRATDGELKAYFNANKDAFNGTQVRASHILIKTDGKTPVVERDKARQKLQQLKADIEAGKLTFADAANTVSQDDANVANKNGGDLGFFPRRGQFIDAFAAAAFALKDQKGKISDPIETEYGLHLITVTDVKPGQTLEADQVLTQAKDDLLYQYAADLQTKVIEAERAQAKIQLQPMPADLFALMPPAPTAATTPAPANAPSPSSSPTGGAPAATAAPK